MLFLAPLFLLGALAIGLPVAFHLIRRTSREVTLFSSLMFLKATPPRVTRRSRLENIWLLLLRCLAIVLLALGFARPLIQRESASTQPLQPAGKRAVVLIDTSASMTREDLWQQAQAKVDDVFAHAASGDELALIAFDRTSRTLLSFEEWRQIPPGVRDSAAASRLKTTRPTWASTELGHALENAAALLDGQHSEQPKSREIILVSDLQEGSRLGSLQGFNWPRGIEVTLAPVRAKRSGGASIQWLTDADASEPTTADSESRLRVINLADSTSDRFTLQWAGEAGIQLQVPPGQSRIVHAPKPSDLAAATGEIDLIGEGAMFERLYVVTPKPTHIPVLFLGNETAENPKQSLYYLARAFQDTRRQRVELIAHSDGQPPSEMELRGAQLLVIGDETSEPAIAAARKFALGGKIVLLPMTSESSEQALSRLLESPALSAAEAASKDYAMLSQIDFAHPIFAAFADPRFSDFTKIHFWNYRQLDTAKIPGAKILAHFDTGDAAVVQVPIGKGSVVVFTSSWRPADSQLALSSKFVPLLYALLDLSSDAQPRPAQYFVGDDVAMSASPLPHKVRRPHGKETEVASGAKFTGTDEPGVYLITPENERFVVNSDPEEGKTAPMEPSRLASLGVPLHSAAAPPPTPREQMRARAGEQESRQKLWRWLIVFALGVLLAETLLAAKLSSATPVPEPQP